MKKTNNIFDHTDCISQEMLIKYASGKLAPAEKHGVEKHLADCEMCSDAVEGLAMVGDPKRISKIASELNQKIQNRIERRGGTVIFLQQYRSQLAIAASVVVLLGLVFFFRNNMSMKEMDQESSDKIFAEKFEAPPADLAVSETEDAEKEAGSNGQVRQEYPAAAATHEPVSNLTADEQKDANSVEKFGWAANTAISEDVPVQKTKSETRDKDDHGKNAEVTVKTNLNTTSTSTDVKFRDEDAALSGKKYPAENRNEQQLYKEKDEKSEARPQAVPVASSAARGAVSGSYQYTQPVTDKYVLSPKEPMAAQQQSNKPAEELSKAEEKKMPDGENAVSNEALAFESLESTKKSGGRERRKNKEGYPIKSSEHYQTEATAASSAPEVQTKVAQAETGAALDSVSRITLTAADVGGDTGEAAGLDAGMIEYDKQDYAGALGNFEAALKQNPNDEKALFYAAVSYLSLGQTEKAVTNLNKVLENKSGPYYDSAQWYLSLAYIKNNDTRNARRNLVELQNNSRSRYQKQADETLKEMQK